MQYSKKPDTKGSTAVVRKSNLKNSDKGPVATVPRTEEAGSSESSAMDADEATTQEQLAAMDNRAVALSAPSDLLGSPAGAPASRAFSSDSPSPGTALSLLPTSPPVKPPVGGASDVQSLLDAAMADVHSTFAAQLANTSKQVTGTMQRLVTDLDAKFEGRHQHTEADVRALQTDMGRLEAGNIELRALLTQLQERVGVAEQTSVTGPPTPGPAGNWDRDIDKSLIRLRTASHAHITRLEAEKTFARVLEDANIKVGDWSLLGDKVSAPTFTARISGLAPAADRKVGQFFGACRSNGKWKEFHAALPNGSQERVFFSRDENPKQQFLAFASKKALSCVLSQFKDQKLFADRSRGLISRQGWRSLLKVEVHADRPAQVFPFNKELEELEEATKQKFDRPRFMREFLASLAKDSHDQREMSCV